MMKMEVINNCKEWIYMGMRVGGSEEVAKTVAEIVQGIVNPN